ncbi:unnamed protein product [Linum tenue]|uniref:Uncharacterized protein n=1 Tax=Linum tenue TaxID=586396 RepID=A0AAV0I3W0_9ROSI|nr:unnamed protein product [Linum tenue]
MFWNRNQGNSPRPSSTSMGWDGGLGLRHDFFIVF